MPTGRCQVAGPVGVFWSSPVPDGHHKQPYLTPLSWSQQPSSATRHCALGQPLHTCASVSLCVNPHSPASRWSIGVALKGQDRKEGKGGWGAHENCWLLFCLDCGEFEG